MEELNNTCSENVVGTDQTFDCVDFGLRVFHGVFLSLILIATLLFNCTVLGLVYRYKELRKRSILVCLGLVFADLFTAIVWIFQGIVTTIAGKWPFSDIGCSIFTYVYLTCLFVRWCEVLAFTTDRFCQILFPFCYERRAKVLVIIYTLIAWGLPMIVSIPVPALGFTGYYLSLTACSVLCRENSACSTGFITLFGVFILIGGVVPTIMYMIIYIYGRVKIYTMRRRLRMGSGEGIPHSSSVNRFQLSAAERRALITCFLVFLTNILTNIPLYITTSLRSRDPVYQLIPIGVHFLSTYIFLLGPVLDPLVIMRTKDFRAALHRTLTCKQTVGSHRISSALRGIVALSIPVSDSFSKSNSDTNNNIDGEVPARQKMSTIEDENEESETEI